MRNHRHALVAIVTLTAILAVGAFVSACSALQPSQGQDGRPHTAAGDVLEAAGQATGQPLLVLAGTIVSLIASKFMATGAAAKKDAEGYTPEDVHAMVVGIATRPDLLVVLGDALRGAGFKIERTAT